MGQCMYAQELSYEEVLFQNTPALFTSLRVKAASVPEGLHRYEIREEGGEPCQLAQNILVDHYGTLLTSDPIQLPADGYLSFSEEELVFSGAEMTTLEDFQRKHPPTGRDVMELFTAADAGLAPADGEKILPVEHLSCSRSGDLLQLQVVDGNGTERALTLLLRGGEGAVS